jgi:pyruvate/2-oxoglutarate dehydrogenase complex dihydrolipoamide acyltransferase (E2) component
MTFDHQSLDGAPAARFLKKLTETIAHIDLMLAV